MNNVKEKNGIYDLINQSNIYAETRMETLWLERGHPPIKTFWKGPKAPKKRLKIKPILWETKMSPCHVSSCVPWEHLKDTWLKWRFWLTRWCALYPKWFSLLPFSRLHHLHLFVSFVVVCLARVVLKCSATESRKERARVYTDSLFRFS